MIKKNYSDYEWLIWCDANQHTGLGHLNRCLGFAEALLNAKKTCVFEGDYDLVAQNIITSNGFCFKLKKKIGSDNWIEPKAPCQTKKIIVDSYNIKPEDLSKIREYYKPAKIVVIDDFSFLEYYDCDAVINFTVGAKKHEKNAASYFPLNNSDYPELYLGPEYYPARNWLKEVRRERNSTISSIVNKVLVIPGGTDKTGVAFEFLQLLSKINLSLELAVLLPEESSSTLQPLLKKFKKVHHLKHMPNLADWYKWADVCLCGGGLIKYECLYAGLPVAALSQTKDQYADSLEQEQLGLVCNLGWIAEKDQKIMVDKLASFINNELQRQSLIDKGLELVGSEKSEIIFKPFI